MKKFLALVLALVMTMSLVTVSASAKTDFTDDAKITNEEAVEVLNAMGVLTGYADGSFRPQATLTRGAGAKIIAYLVLGQKAADKLQATYTVYKDVTDSVGLAAYIEWAAANGIVDGYGDGNFGPYNTLTQYAFGKMLLTALGYSSEKEGYTGAGWQKSVYTEAVRNGIFDGTETYGACDRETAARMALGALESNIVAYGTKTTAGSYVWNGQTVTGARPGSVTVTGAVELGKTLAELYGVSKATKADIFARPGHTWSYKTWSKFYMDEAVVSYTDKTSACDVLVDLGVAKTSNGSAKIVKYYVDGKEVTANEYTLTHKNCSAYFGGKGTLTEVFEVTGGYRITEVHTYLAKVTYVDAAKHAQDLDESNIKIFYDKDDNYGPVCLEGVLLTKGEYVLVQNGNYAGEDVAVAVDEYLTYNSNTFYGYTKVLGAAQSFEGKLTAKTQEEALTLVVAGTSYAAAQEYNVSYAWNALNTTAVWFLDQYGNIIGDFAPASAAPEFGVLDAIVWVHGNGVNAAQYAEANFVAPDAKQSVIKVDTYGTEVLAGADTTTVEVGKTVSDIQALNGIAMNNTIYFAKANNYGVVSYTIGTDGNYDVAKAGTATGITTLKKGQSNIGGYACDDETVYLVRTKDAVTGAAVYTQYVGFNAIPNMSALTDIVVCYKNHPTDAYVDFAFVIADNAIYDGSKTEAYVINKNWTKVDNGVYYYNIFVNGKPTEITAKVGDLFTKVTDTEECNIFTVSFDSNGYATEAAEAKDYTHDVTVNYVGSNVINVLNTSAAKVYLVGATEVTEVAASTIAVGDTVCYTVDADYDYILDTVYIIAQASNNNEITKPVA